MTLKDGFRMNVLKDSDGPMLPPSPKIAPREDSTKAGNTARHRQPHSRDAQLLSAGECRALKRDLSGAEAARRLAVYGPNEAAPVRRLSAVVQPWPR